MFKKERNLKINKGISQKIKIKMMQRKDGL
jgi:hypothetical protein